MQLPRAPTSSLLPLWLCAGIAASAAAQTPAPARSAADLAHDALQAAAEEPFDPARVLDATLDFCLKYPEDRRVPLMVEKLPYVGSRRLTTEERAVCEARLLERFADAIETPDLGDMTWGLLMKAGIRARSTRRSTARARTSRERARGSMRSPRVVHS